MHLPSFLNIGSRPARLDCIGRLNKAVTELAILTSDTEGDFLTIGENLRDFYARIKEVSTLSASITERMAGREVTEAMEGLQEVFDRIGLLDAESGQGRDALTSILQRFEGIQNHLQGFDKTVRNLHILCNFIRIESARSGRKDTGFDTLSDDVQKLAGNIESQSALLLDQSLALATLIGQNLEKIRRFEEDQHRQAGRILNDAVTNLAALKEKHGHSTAALKNLSDRWSQLSLNIGEVVSSMQFHDITRQRIEHVRDALSELAERLQRSGGNVDGAGRGRRRTGGAVSEQVALVADTCELQAAQLRHARDELVSAVLAIIENCRNIVCNVEEMTEETGQLIGVHGNGGRSFFAGLEGNLSSLITAVCQYVDVNRELSAALYRVTGTVEEMSSFVSEIEKIGFRMKMVALNASVHAARIGEEGLGLGVLAEALHPLSVETSRQIGVIADTLNAVITSSRGLTTLLDGDSADPGKDTERMAAHLEALMAPLRRLDENNLSLLARMDGAVKALSEDVGRATTAIRVHERIDRKVGEVDAGLLDLVAGIRSVLPAGGAGGGRVRLEGLSERYTMDKEREIHQSITALPNPAARLDGGGTRNGSPETGNRHGSGDPAPIAAGVSMVQGAGPVQSPKEDLGDNVELF